MPSFTTPASVIVWATRVGISRDAERGREDIEYSTQLARAARIAAAYDAWRARCEPVEVLPAFLAAAE